jgi:hypothetical protein
LGLQILSDVFMRSLRATIKKYKDNYLKHRLV